MFYDHACARCGKPLNVYSVPSNVPKVHRDCMAYRQKDLTPEREEMLRGAYARAKNLPQLSQELSHLMQQSLFLPYPRHVLHEWARSLGLSRVKRIGPWSAEETQILETNANECTLWQIYRKFQRAGFQRSLSAIAVRIHRNGWGYRGDYYSVAKVAEAMGSSYEMASSWVKKGLLKPHHSNGQGVFVSPLELARFIWRHPEEAGQGRPDIPFLVALLNEFKREL